MSDEKLIAAERAEAAWKGHHKKVLDRLVKWQERHSQFIFADPSKPDRVEIPYGEWELLLREMSLLHPLGDFKCPPMTKKLPFFTPSRRRKKTSRSTAA